MKIAIVGLGYVGLPLAIQFSRSECEVLGLDVDKAKVESINRSESYIKHITSAELEAQIKSGRLEASTDFTRIQEVEAVLICVPTPLNKNREPDLSYVLKTGEAIAPHLAKGVIVSLESTTYPGTTEDDLKPVLEVGSGLKAGVDFHLVYSPEREDPGNPDSQVAKIPKVIGGYTKKCLEKGQALYSIAINTLVPVSSCRVAEATKLTENIFRCVNIALVNELKVIYRQMEIDVWEVIDAAKTKPFGYMPFYPGPGLGGHCIPIDPFYLSWKARQQNLQARFIELAGEVNLEMPDYVISRCENELTKNNIKFDGSRILVLGIAYKPDVDDMRESPAVELMQKLRNKGVQVEYSDPHIPVFPKMREYAFDLQSVELKPEIITNYDLLLLATNHSAFDYVLIQKYAKIIVDARGVYKNREGNVVKA
ncbi:MAG: UDP-N-acetyl-D-glucosamine dehydrogenase [Rhodopirellula sp.]|nr:UDP-N-acetyl-D-glucosamine dehydrogenase [Rhodopirellula sp.]|tara:strand:+ start:9137 stop:10408 length:1272 start_codon:yes stop_codon:yes gene_type:complete